MSELTISKLFHLFKIAEPTFRRLGQRPSGFYHAYSPRKRSCHYSAISESFIQTIEFRFFRGNLRQDRIMKNLETVCSMIAFCEETYSVHITADGYLQHITKNAHQYPHLSAFLADEATNISQMEDLICV